jgi:hypothetical protein
MKIFLLIAVIYLLFPLSISAAEQNFVTYVIPVRGLEYWRNKDVEQISTLKALTLPLAAKTWLLQFDALIDDRIMVQLDKSSGNEYGVFLEVTPKLAEAAFVGYDWESEKWERADKLFLSGYQVSDRKKLIDKLMDTYHQKFNSYPESVGAWYIDGWSLNYLQTKYQIKAVLGLADQYLTDGYQVWGQYVGYPYYPSITDVHEPALNNQDKIDLVKIQWAMREPLLSYGSGINYSNYSTQVNDYVRYHHLDQKYLEKLLKTYTFQVKAPVSQITIGIEAGELDQKYFTDLEDQISQINNLKLTALTMSHFAQKYKQAYPDVSPQINIYSEEAGRRIDWIMSPEYRLGKITSEGKTQIVDFRQYHQSSYLDDDYYLPDKRKNLYRIIPAEVDNISMRNVAENINVENQPRNIKKSLSLHPFRWLPDIRYSFLNKRFVFGISISPTTLYGIDLNKKEIGKLEYNFRVLQAFKNLHKIRDWVYISNKRSRDQLQDFANHPGLSDKDADYGINNLQIELTKPKLFESSYYYVAK